MTRFRCKECGRMIREPKCDSEEIAEIEHYLQCGCNGRVVRLPIGLNIRAILEGHDAALLKLEDRS